MSALLMGLAGTPHCLAMCGALQTAIAQRQGRRQVLRQTLVLHLGRLVGYAAAGGVVAGSIGALRAMSAVAPMLRPVWALIHVGFVVLGVAMLWRGAMPAWLAAVGTGRTWRRLQQIPAALFTSAPSAPSAHLALATAGSAGGQPLRFTRRMPASVGTAAAGACWGLMPCGLLQSALLVAALASGPLPGAAVMSAFAAGSAAGLVVVPLLWHRRRADAAGRGEAHAAPPREARLSLRLAGALLAAASCFALWQVVAGGLSNAICLT